MFASLRAFFISILIFLLTIPYGFDEPVRAFIRECSLTDNAVVCEQTENGAEATFTLRMVHDNRPVRTVHAFNDFQIKVFVSDGDPALNKEIDNTIYEWPFEVIGWDEEYPPVEILERSIAFENDPGDFIKAGDEFTLVVHLTLPGTTAPGTYSVAVSPNYAQECIFLDSLIVN